MHVPGDIVEVTGVPGTWRVDRTYISHCVCVPACGAAKSFGGEGIIHVGLYRIKDAAETEFARIVKEARRDRVQGRRLR